ncbi:MAG: F0F1 ATP synthase subunit B [Bacteroidales bacterium]|nr:F0F1 ATP synthase subunit B [Bacteroidales bacterium]
MSLFSPDIGLLFWMALSFGVVFFIVAKWGFPVITRMVEERKEYIDKSLQKADEVNSRMAQLQKQSDLMLEETRATQLAMLRETAQIREQILSEAKELARQKTEKFVQETKKQIGLERAAALTEVRNQAVVMAVDIAEKILRKELKEKDRHMEYVNRLLEDECRNHIDALR